MSKRRRRKISNETFTTNITSLSHEGRGIAHLDGKTTFIFGALPGETVEFRYSKKRGSYDEGYVTNVLEASKDRVDAKCPNFGICGGCSLQHMQHDTQIKHKQTAFLELLKQQSNIEPQEILTPLIASPWGYRRKARIGVKHVPKKEKVLVGFRERNSPYVTNMDICFTLHPSVGKEIAALSTLFMTLETKDHLPQCEVAIDDNETAIILRHLVPLPEKDLDALENFFKQRKWRLYLQPKGIDSIHLHYPKLENPLLQYQLPKYDLKLEFHPAQFTQINSEINRQMIDRALDLLDLQETDHVLDLFCGIGNFTLPITKQAKKVIGIEGDDTAVAQAKNNATLNQITNTEFYSANLFEPVNHFTWSQATFDKILLDPPRSGAQEILENMSIWQPQKIIYISCNPATLARDAGILCQQGYHLDKAGIMDMFPHTQHVEAMALFERSP